MIRPVERVTRSRWIPNNKPAPFCREGEQQSPETDDPALRRPRLLQDGTRQGADRKIVPVAFELLPLPAQRAVHQYMMVDGWRPDFAEELRFIVGGMSATDMAARCWNAPDNDMRNDYPDWDDYHASYCACEDPEKYTTHLAGMWPVILCDREGIVDGWHRLHWYLRNGIAVIPTIDFVEAI